MDKKFRKAEAEFTRKQIHTQFSERGMHLKRVRVGWDSDAMKPIYQIQVARNKVRQAPYIASPEAQARARARA